MRARELKALRARLGLSQNGLAEALGMHRQSIVKYEGGELPFPQVVTLALEMFERRAAEGSKRQRPA